ncbi:MAG: hypothetical protein M1357_02945 [Candidatus Marsarchaeota archaeon]|nr:hypothetical protein [Candidatus Marsarchaeota archaeon]
MQFALYFAVWVTGIFVNGYVFIPFSRVGSIFTEPPLLAHAASAGALGAVSAAAVSVYVVNRETRRALLGVSSMIVLFWAAAQGLLFLSSGGVSTESFEMALGFISSLFLSFVAALPDAGSRTRDTGAQMLCTLCLGLSFLVFASGMYLNLNAGSRFFSLPPLGERREILQFTTGPQFVVHALLGSAYVVSTGGFFIYSLLRKRLTGASASAFFLSVYPALFGILNTAFISLPSPIALAASMASASSFFLSIMTLMYAYSQTGSVEMDTP